MKIELFQGDCLELMKGIPGGSVDMVMADLPYGTTKNKWDKTIPLACVNTGRSFIGIELDPGYFETAKRRIEEAQEQANQPNLFKETGA